MFILWEGGLSLVQNSLPLLRSTTTTAAVKSRRRRPNPHPQWSVSNCSPSRTISPLEPDVPDIQRFWQPARWESHHRINENIREEEKKRRAEEAVVYFTVNIFTSRHLSALKYLMILLLLFCCGSTGSSRISTRCGGNPGK